MEKPYCGGQCKRKGRDPLFQRSAAFLLRKENYDVRRKAREQRPPAREHRERSLHQAADGTVLWNGTLQANGNQDVKIPASVTGISVSIGNATVTKMSLDGSDVNLMNNNAIVWNANMTFQR